VALVVVALHTIQIHLVPVNQRITIHGELSRSYLC
jgi:hypothetical protein